MFDYRIFFQSFVSPSLYMMQRTVWERYPPNEWEKLGDNLIALLLIFYKVTMYSSPIIGAYIYKRGYISPESIFTLSRLTVGLGLIMGSSYCIRSYGRASNEKYKTFLSKLNVAKAYDRDSIKPLKRYDFDFSSWPVEFENQERIRISPSETKGWRSSLTSLIYSPCSILGYVVLHTFGIRMIYPGSTSILNFVLNNVLIDGRKVLIENKRGERFKIKTFDGNFIDTMFVDKRSLGGDKSRMLVVCAEGNAGYYENGIMPTAIDAGYSVLGWNHPGFGCSTGMPYPEQEQNAMDAVMQFAITKLGFQPSSIILYGWSIGGYCVSWAAVQYPEIQGIVLDATFDDILPLALNQMPDFLESIVRTTIRSYADLNVSKYLVEYPGPVKLIRRTEDEVICIIPGEMNTNRGNFLLKKLLKRRYPSIFTNSSEQALQDWFETSGTSRENVLLNYDMDREMCQALIEDYKTQHGGNFPYLTLGKEAPEDTKINLVLCLAEKYMVDYASTHCTPLPSSLFSNLSDFSR